MEGRVVVAAARRLPKGFLDANDSQERRVINDQALHVSHKRFTSPAMHAFPSLKISLLRLRDVSATGGACTR